MDDLDLSLRTVIRFPSLLLHLRSQHMERVASLPKEFRLDLTGNSSEKSDPEDELSTDVRTSATRWMTSEEGASEIGSRCRSPVNQRVQMLMEDSFRSSKQSSRKHAVGSAGKEYHFFLSHKKQHSRDGSVHAQIAQYLIDSLQQLNFTGFLDIDSLDEISAGALRAALKKSCSLVILLNDETYTSDWCQLEWEIAGELELPVKVIIDMERASKATEVQRAEASHPHLLTYQWTEYTGKRRREALNELTVFLTKHTLSHGRSNLDDSDGSSVSSERVRTTWYPKLNFLLLWGGFTLSGQVLREDKYRFYWICAVRSAAYMCLCVCMLRLLYATGPAFTDHCSTLATVVLHFHLIYAPIVIQKTVRSNEFKSIMHDTYMQGTSFELLQSVFFVSKVLYHLGLLLVIAALFLYIVCWEPLFFSGLYIAESRSAVEKSFGWASGILFFFGILTLIPLFVCIHIFSALIKLMSTIPCESSPDSLHPQIASLGLQRRIDLRWRILRSQMAKHRNPENTHVVDLGSVADVELTVPPLMVTDDSKRTFGEHWQMGWATYESIHSQLFPLQNVMMVWASICLIVPLALALQSAFDDSFVIDRFSEEDKYLYYVNCLRLAWIWVQGPTFVLLEHLFGVVCTLRLENAVQRVRQLSFSDSQDYVAVMTMMNIRRPCRFTSLRVPATPCTLAFAVVVFLVSGIPWFFVRFSP